MAAAATLLRQRVKEVVEAEFAAEGFIVENDKLGRSAGKDGAARVAVYPGEERQDYQNANVLTVQAILQVYLPYDANPDENIAVDPAIIEGYAARLRDAFREQSTGTGSDFWFLHLILVDYPDDPTGNKSRLEATFEAKAENTAALG